MLNNKLGGHASPASRTGEGVCGMASEQKRGGVKREGIYVRSVQLPDDDDMVV